MGALEEAAARLERHELLTFFLASPQRQLQCISSHACKWECHFNN